METASDTGAPTGTPPGPIFIFLHGLASTEADLRPLALEAQREGFRVESLRLPIHQDSVDRLSVADINDIAEWVRPILTRYEGFPVYLVGFSTGAAIAVLLSRVYPIAGIVGISTFLGPRRRILARYALPILETFPALKLPRIAHTTTRKTRQELALTKSLSLNARRIAIHIGCEASAAMDDVTCPMLLVHSLDDSVADYRAVASGVRKTRSHHARLISFSSLDHFMQFDVPPVRLFEFILHYLDIAPRVGDVPSQPKPEDILKIYADERRHWTLILFQVIAGAFTIFALLLYNTLSDVLNDTTRAPYYLLSYSMTSSIYVVLASLYLFYANRVDAYIRLCIEPLLPGIRWSAFRFVPFISGRLSPTATRLTTIPLIVVPCLISIGTLFIVLIKYSARILSLQPELAVPTALCLLLVLISLSNATRHSGFAERYLKLTSVPLKSDHETEHQLYRLYSSVSPGCVRAK